MAGLGRAKWLLAGGLAALAMPVAAQETESGGLDDIVVTAQRRDQKLQDVPLSITAVASETIQRMQINNATDLNRIVPNVKFDPVSGGSTGLKPYIRGGGVADGGMVLSESEVGIYVDGIYRARLSAAYIDTLELERIEVVRGPQGVLYGRNSSAGAVNFITREPTEEFTATAEAGYGTWNERRLRGFISGPISEDGKWRASLNGLVRARDGGRQYNVTLDKAVGSDETQGVQGDLAYVGDAVSGRLTLFYTHVSGDGQWAVNTHPDGDDFTPNTGSYRRVASPVESYTHVKQYGATLRLSADMPGGQVTSLTGFSKLDDKWRQDFSGGVDGAVLGMPGTMLALFDRTSATEQSQFSQEFQAGGSLLPSLDYVAGVYFFTETGDQDVLTKIFFAPTDVEFRAKTNSFAGFGQLSWAVAERLTLIAGGRYSIEDKKLRGSINGQDFNLSNSWSRFTPKLGVDFQVDPSVLLYLSYSQGFRSGGYNGLGGSYGAITAAFLPQYTTAYEGGVKADLLDNRLRFNLAAFYNKLENRQQSIVLTSGPDIGNVVVENYDAELKGLELEATLKVAEGLTLWANGALNEGKYTDCSASALVSCTIIDNKLPVFPDWTFALGFDWAVDVGPGTLRLGSDFNARDSYYSTADNVQIGWVESQKFLNGYVGYDIGHWTLQVTGKNILDESSWSTGFGFSVVQPRFSTDPRTVLGTVRYLF